MTQLSITFDDKLVRQGLQNLAAEIPKIGRLGIRRTEEAIVRRLKLYWTHNTPPELPSYVRSGDLAKGYTITALPNGYTLSNATDYTSLVVGNAYGLGQAKVHRYRHPLMRDIQDQEVTRLPQEIKDEIIVVARREGF